MNHGRDRAEPAPEPGYHLRRQRDFRHQDDRALPHGQGFAYRFHEDFRLPAAGDPMKQEPPAFTAQAGQDFLQGFLLPGSQLISGIRHF